ncbi:MAG: hypothetical protein GYB20_05700 [Oceanospirillales bacterium]|nr:hypothetical protein [Oceanospirillales bacterium]MBR9887174.1 hypothetical protein [Oceanospirillales bacterium]
MKNIRTRKRKNSRTEKPLSDIHIVKIILSQSNTYAIERSIENYITNLSPERQLRVSKNLYKHKRIREVFNLKSEKYTSFIKRNISTNLDSSVLLNLFLKFVIENKELINKYNNLALKLEENICLGSYNNVIKTIDEIDNIFGKTIWSIDARLSIYSIFNKVKESEILQKSDSNIEIAQITSLLTQRNIASSANAFHDQFFSNVLNEYEKTSQLEYANMLSLLITPERELSNLEYDPLITISQSLNVIDRVILYKKLFRLILTDQKQYHPELKDTVRSFVKELSSHINDESWKNMASFDHKKIKTRSNKEQLYIIEKYSKGEYEECVDLIDNYLKSNPRDLSAIDILCKSIIFLDDDNFSHSILEGQRVRVAITGALIGLLSDFNKYDLYMEQFKTLELRYSCFDFILSARPMFMLAYPFISKERIIKSCMSLACTDLPLSPKYASKIDNNDVVNSIDVDFLGQKELNKDSLTRSRIIRIEIQEAFQSKSIDRNKIISMLEILTKETDILTPEKNYILSKSLIALDEWEKIFSLVADEFIENRSSHLTFPIEEIANHIENCDIYVNDIKAIICYYIYSSTYSKASKILAAERVEDYLAHNNYGLPSELLSNITKLDKYQEFFFSEVCNREMLGDLININSSKMLNIERLKLISFLNDNFNYSNNNLLAEERNIFDVIIFGDIAVEHGYNKINIDSHDIKKSKFSDYSGHFEQFRNLGDLDHSSIKSLFEDSDEELTSENAINHFYGVLYQKIVSDFIQDNDYGLVRYLSSEIRHGVMPNQLRSVFEAHKLITEKGPGNKYETNSHWDNIYKDTLSNDYLLVINKNLEEFSEQVDKLIDNANNWAAVTTNINDRNIAFNFGHDTEKLKKLRRYVENQENSDQFFERCTEFIWSEVDDCLKIMRSLLNKELKADFEALCNNLCVSLSSRHNPTQLFSHITQARNAIIEEIAKIETWFRRPHIALRNNYPLRYLIEKSIECVEDIHYPKEIKYHTNICESFNEIYVNNDQKTGLTRSLITTYQNCIKYTPSEPLIHFDISTYKEDNKIKIVISNEIDKKRIKNGDAELILKKVDNFKKTNQSTLLSKEGGTGLYKAYRYVFDYIDNSDLNIEILNNKFYQKITISEDSLS